MLGKAGRSETFPGLNKMSTPYPCPPSPQASAYLKQNKYQQAEELYKEILSQEALPAPLGAPQGGTAGDTQQQVSRLHLRSLLGPHHVPTHHCALPRSCAGAVPSLSSGNPSGEEARSWSPASEERAWQGLPGECRERSAVCQEPSVTSVRARDLQSSLSHSCLFGLLFRMKRAMSLNMLNVDGPRAARTQVRSQ